MKRFLVVLLVLGWFVSIAQGPAGAAQMTIRWWEHANPPHNKLSKELSEKYAKENPGIKVDYQFFPMTPFFKKLAVAISTGTAPDMFTIFSPIGPSLAAKKGMAALNPVWLGYKSLDDMKKAYLPGALDGYIYDGKLYAVPVLAQTFSLYLDMNHFREAGLDPKKDYPRTWDDIARIGKKLVKMKGGRMEREGFDFAMISSAWTMINMEPMIRQYGGSILDESGKKCVVNSEAGVKAMKLRASFALVHKISDPTVTVATHPLPASDLAVGRVSMFITHPGSVAQFGPKRMKDIMVVRHPQLDPSNPVTATYGFALSVNPQISEKRQKAVHKFIRYLSENPKMWLERVGTVNPHAGILDIPGVRERPYIDVFVNDISSGVHLTQSPKYNEIADAMHRAMERVVLNRADPKKSLDQACKEIDRALARP